MTTAPDGSGGVPPGVLAALKEARTHGLLGEVPIETQVAHALGFASAAEEVLGAPPRDFVDLGSGGGLPGLVLAGRWPDSGVILLDASHRRCAALTRNVENLGWSDRVRAVCMRAEEAGRDPRLRGSQALVVARSFGPPAVTAECGAPLLEVGGLLVVSEPPGRSETDGSSPGSPDRWPPGPLGDLGLRPLKPWAADFSYQVLVQEQPSPDRYPRRPGIPTKRPLYR